MNNIESYINIPLKKVQIEDVVIGLRQIGNGENLVFIHGFPTHGYTWRKIVDREMISQFNSKIKFTTIKNASLLPHEERPDEVAEEIVQFIKEETPPNIR